MVDGLVTVVLPIYNVEKQLNRCIESVVNQTYKNIEIILVDDGSVDSCPAICDEWAKKDYRIRVIHKQNQGLGMARNTGIENANGEFICFFDSDDFIEPETIEKAYRRAKDENADIVNFGTNFCDESGKVKDSFISPAGNVSYEGKDVLGFFLPEFIAPDPQKRHQAVLYESVYAAVFNEINKTNFLAFCFGKRNNIRRCLFSAQSF